MKLSNVKHYLVILFFLLIVIKMFYLINNFNEENKFLKEITRLSSLGAGEKIQVDIGNVFTTSNFGLNCSSKWESTHFLVEKGQCKTFNRFSNVNLITDPNNYITANITSEKYLLEVVYDGLIYPFSIDVLPNKVILISEESGSIVFINETNGKKIKKINLNGSHIRGLMGITHDPNFKNNKFIYFYNYVSNKNGSLSDELEITRAKLSNQYSLNETKIIFTGIKLGKTHSGGRIRFGPDGKLYITTGDYDPNVVTAQDKKTINGAILRINKNGSIPKDNPFGNAIYSYGHRNPQGIDWHPKTKKLYSTEHGFIRMDEINIIKKGGNYGWPFWACDMQIENVENSSNLEIQEYNFPILCFYDEKYKNKSNYYTVAPSGGSFVTDPYHPWYNNFFFAALRGGHLHRLVFLENGSIKKNEIFLLGFGRIRDVYFNSNNGKLYIITSNSDVNRFGQAYNISDKLIALQPI